MIFGLNMNKKEKSIRDSVKSNSMAEKEQAEDKGVTQTTIATYLNLLKI